ncbi:methyltransferase domain-containing protein [Polaribacter batillariae]|uniref:Methyltransferase domain-containing protein n=1 Tax=Polaribacter batillariae TaxID=2808900 RepID=A0ABX7SX63_9FLAO|nr:methyltransferase domain-containing protein [Polaribacter batillariae]QTD37424.1 methyltransferase domain-containing protein [Polaribacter batillariae]
MEIERKSFQGVLNILSFNRHFYVIGLIVLFLMISISLFFNIPNFIIWLIIGAFLYGFLMPLLVSAYVYDFSGYYHFNWLNRFKIVDSKENTFVNINAGFDETSFILKNKFPKSHLKVFDFYNANKHTEPAIVRARKVTLKYPNTQHTAYNAIPLKNNSVDVIFLLSAAHEIRNNNEKVAFLTECKRICKTNGKVIMVEHLRDVPNFFAFSVGFTHFFSSKTWKHVFRKARFTAISETKFTPFMSVFTAINK